MVKELENINLEDSLILGLEHTAKIAKLSGLRFFEKGINEDITYNDFVIIDTLHSHPHIHQRNLAKLLFKGTANLSRDLDKLEERGLISRNIESKDNRIVKTLTLTKDGEKTFNRIATLAKDRLMFIESIYTIEERELFREFLNRLKDKLIETEGVVID